MLLISHIEIVYCIIRSIELYPNNTTLNSIQQIFTTLQGCRNAWVEFENSCYKFFTSRVNWFTARDACLGEDSHLASVHSSEEQAFLKDDLITWGYDGVWIGGKMGTFEYQWEDGSQFDFTDWYSSEPNYDGECIYMYESSSYYHRWFDNPCTTTNCYVCKQTLF